MKKYFTAFKYAALMVLMLQAKLVNADNETKNHRQFHPPVNIQENGYSITALFLRYQQKDSRESAAATGEIHYIQTEPFLPELNYVWKTNGDEIASVFLYGGHPENRPGKSLFVITKSSIENDSFKGSVYSALELPVILQGRLALEFFPGDPLDEALKTCYEGIDLDTGQAVTCLYKDEASIARFLNTGR
ncbi:hypothetical protein [Halopseudomonas sp.]|jgi:hypothetical protein|uniref:hypothetical protein n=1 Tax=Halopseudomonas sp. TaxID=2901191 RepID=UPI0039E492AE